MSSASKLVLLGAVSVSASIIGYVHYKQSLDRLKLHEGVLRDVEQQQRRKHENRYSLQQQIDITKQLKKIQNDDLKEDTPKEDEKTSEVETDIANPNLSPL